MSGFSVDLGAMGQAVKGIEDTVAALKEFAPDGGTLVSITVSFGAFRGGEDVCGDKALAEALDEFFERWGWGLRHLVKEGTELASALAGTRKEYEVVEGKLKEVFQALSNDPGSSADPTKQSWQDLLQRNSGRSSPGQEWDKATAGVASAWNSSVQAIFGEEGSAKPASDRK